MLAMKMLPYRKYIPARVAHEQAAQQDTGEKENIHYENVAIPEVHIPHKKKK